MTWKPEKLAAQLTEVDALREWVVVSGGLAWHIMSPPHVEAKTTHDHKDVDLFVMPQHAAEVFATLRDRGFDRYWTKYDGLDPAFYRYGLTAAKPDGHHVKVLFDLFVREVPSVEVGGYRIVEPSFLLTLYETSHSSKECRAVRAATKLLAAGISPIGRSELVTE